MARQRKGKSTPSNDTPLVKPSDLSEKKLTKPLLEISEEEQRRLINDSGVLKKIPKPDQEAPNALLGEEDTEPITFGEQVLNTILYVVPFTFLLTMMEILIHYQYHRRPTVHVILDRLISSVPVMGIFMFYTSRYKSHKALQILLLAISTISGCRLIYQINHANWLTNMKQCPPLATIWIYTVFMADLGPAFLSLLTIGGFVWWKELKIIL